MNKEILIIEAKDGFVVRNLLNDNNLYYEIYKQNITSNKKKNIFSGYDNHTTYAGQRNRELSLWDKVDLDEDLNIDGEWWK